MFVTFFLVRAHVREGRKREMAGVTAGQVFLRVRCLPFGLRAVMNGARWAARVNSERRRSLMNDCRVMDRAPSRLTPPPPASAAVALLWSHPPLDLSGVAAPCPDRVVLIAATGPCAIKNQPRIGGGTVKVAVLPEPAPNPHRFAGLLL